MQISWNGFSSFEIKTGLPNGEVTIVTDPYDNSTGLRFPRTLEAQVVLITHNEPDANNTAAVLGQPYVIDIPGEFEIRDVFVFGINAPLAREEKGSPVINIIFIIEIEGIKMAHLGALDRKLTDEELQQLSNIDILMIPVGGNKVLTAKNATEVIAQIEPRVVIPMSHFVEGAKEPLDSIDAFCKEMDACRTESANKYKIKRKDLPENDMLIVKLER